MPTADLVGFRLLLPAKWVEVDLDPATRAAGLAAVVDERGGTAVARGASTEELIRLLEAVAVGADAAGASYAAFYSDVFGDQFVSASLVAGAVASEGGPPPAGADAATMAAALRELFAAEGEAEVRALLAGPAIRVRRRTQIPVPGGQVAPIEQVRWLVPMPGLERLCVLEFSTPSIGLAEPFVQLFDAIAGSLTWT